MNKSIKTAILAVVAIVTLCATVSIISEGGLSAEDTPVTTVGTYLDNDSGITFTLYSDQTAEATKLTAPSKDVVIPGKVVKDDIEYTVTSIAASFVRMNSTIETVTIAPSITEIKDGGDWTCAFSECSKLKTVTFEEGSKLTKIGKYAFAGCMSLSEINFPEGLKEIGDNAFSYKTSNGYLPTGRATLYYNLYSLKEITLPASLEKIGDGAFPPLVFDIKLADGNKNFVIDNGILYNADKTVLIKAFNPTGDVTVPSTVTKINSYAFYYQTSDVMSEVVWTSKFFQYSENPVKKDPAIGTLTIPSSVETIGEYGLALMSADTKTPYKELNLPSKFSVNLGKNAFANNPLVKEMYVAADKEVNNTAFNGCKNIETAYILTDKIDKQINNVSAKKLVLSDKLTSVCAYSLSEWINLTTVTYGDEPAEEGVAKFPASLKEIGSNFLNKSAIKVLDISVLSGELPNQSFREMSNLQTIKFGDKITSIGDWCFQTSKTLKEVIIPSSVKSIGSDAFSYCSDLTSIIIMNETKDVKVGGGAFSHSLSDEGNLKVVKITYRTDAGDHVVKTVMEVNLPKDGDGKITDGTITISKEVVAIEDGVLPDEGITNIIIEDGNETYVLKDKVLYTKDMKTLVYVPDYSIGEDGKFVVPDSVTVIGAYALSHIPKLTAVEFGEASNAVTIENRAFYKSGIESFKAPKNLASVGNYAFYGTSFKTADFTNVKDAKISFGSNAFQKVSTLTDVTFSKETTVDIGFRTFSGTAIKSFEIWAGTTNNYALEGCTQLEYLYLGSGVTKTGSYFISGVTTLKQVVLMNTDTDVIGKTIKADNFSCKSNFVFIVPENSKADYSTFEAKYPVTRVTSRADGTSFIMPVIDGITFTKGEESENGISYTFVLDDAYDRSKVSIKIGDSDVKIENNTFVIKPTGAYQNVIVSGVEVNEYTVDVKVDNAKTTVDVKTVKHGDSMLFNVIPDNCYVLKDLTAKIGETSYKAHHDSWISIPAITDDSVIVITGVVPEEFDVTFVKDGKIVDSKKYVYGQNFVPSDKSDAWYLYDSDKAYDFKQALTDDTAFFASSVSEDSKIEVNFYAARGSIEAYWYAGNVGSGNTVLKGSDVTFAYDGVGSYTVVGWFVNGKYTESADTQIVVKDVQKSVSVQVAVVFEQSDYKYIVNAPMTLPSEEYAKMLWIGTYKDPLDMGSDYYSNMPSGYAAIGDYLYLVSGKNIMRINLNSDFTNGMPVDTLTVTVKDAASTLDTYGGYIFNGTYVYDLDLNYLFEAPSVPLGMYDGDFISLSNNTVKRWSVEYTDEGYVPKEVWSTVLEKHYGKSVIDGDYLFHLPVSTATNEPDRAIESIDLRTGAIKSKVDINKYQYGHYYDDGWLTVYDGWAYIASYTSGLFGEQNPNVTARNPVLLRVAVSDGVFDQDSMQVMEMPNNTQQSGLVVFNGRGYIHSGNDLVVIDMESFKMIYKETGVKTHGGIVLNTYYANADNNYKVYIYVVPYGGSDTVWVYSDDQTKTEAGTPETIDKTGYSQYATTHIRTSASGYIYWYNDSSIFFITGQKYHEVSFVVDGKVVMNYPESVNGTELKIPDAPVKKGYSFVGWYNYDGTPVLQGDVVAGDMTIMAVYAPTVSEANNMMFFDYYASRHAEDGMYVLMIAEYDNNVVWNYQKITFNEYGECQNNVFAVSKNGLKNVSISVVDSCNPLEFNTLDRVAYSFGA